MSRINSMNNIKEYREWFKEELLAYYDEREIDAFFLRLMEEWEELDRITLAMEPGYELSEKSVDGLPLVVEQLKRYRPIQYILGKAWFYDLELEVNEHVLIPRPETEELVQWIISNLASRKNEKLRILDIGTGSGCIALALKNHFPQAEITAIDMSASSLEVAKRNAENLELPVNFQQIDMMEKEQTARLAAYDVIVSNPPYVREQEKAFMQKNVLDYEPENALFVPDSDALKFYRLIADFCVKHLIDNGTLYLEINEAMPNELIELLKEYQFSDILVKKDINEKARMVKAEKVSFSEVPNAISTN
ncbi:MAG: peptide chain release factor N(5)-glutamine methyltransferase [Bacteroidales bacterium]|nr:peptide chain release factor N(5)-glutamine methyltransferase [Bacteroidales bacterium]